MSMITVRLTRQEQEALTWDDLHRRSIPVPTEVSRGRRWVTVAATADEWRRIAAYADGQAEHWASDIGCGADESAAIRRDAARCRKVAARTRAAVAGGVQ